MTINNCSRKKLFYGTKRHILRSPKVWSPTTKRLIAGQDRLRTKILHGWQSTLALHSPLPWRSDHGVQDPRLDGYLMLTTWSDGGLLDGHVQGLMNWSGRNLGNHGSIVETAARPDLVLILVKIEGVGCQTVSN